MFRRLLISMTLAVGAFSAIHCASIANSRQADLNAQMWRALSASNWAAREAGIKKLFNHQIFKNNTTGEIEYVHVAEGPEPDINAKSEGMTPLLWAIKYDQLELIKFIIEMGADVNMQNDLKTQTPLTEVVAFAFGDNAVKATKLLLKHGANPNLAPSTEALIMGAPLVKAYKSCLDFLIFSGNNDIALVKILAPITDKVVVGRVRAMALQSGQDAIVKTIDEAIKEAMSEKEEEKKVAAEEEESFAAPPGGIIGKSGQ